MTAKSLVGPSIITTKIGTYQLIESFDAVVGAIRKVFLDQVIEDELVIRAISLQAYSKVKSGKRFTSEENLDFFARPATAHLLAGFERTQFFHHIFLSFKLFI
jgi:hypothetical protein